MRILLTNDDGVGERGMVALAQVLIDAGHDLVVVGPTSERSGSGTAVGPIEHGAIIPMEKRALDTSPPLEGYALDAPPAMAVIAALSGLFGPRPDLVISGINAGHNVGRSILFSGTVGAAVSAAMLGIPSIAISSGFAPDHRFDTAAHVAAAVVEWFDANGMPRICVNVNVPDVDLDDIEGCRVTHLAPHGMFAIDLSLETDALTLRRKPARRRLGGGTDIDAITGNSIAISALRPLDSIDDEACSGLAEHLSGAYLGASSTRTH
ncbi:5'/3'-nucleotidase SurE [Microbacterium gorillae]|uniref:5'/3'-nucleotidase SurE n=1 Tax=Microbacterium gorillae TaxID=1231063 RepID=UPI00058C8C61|nr:5'/3'-nucleotidase SurE [Microbacterium gorillae]